MSKEEEEEKVLTIAVADNKVPVILTEVEILTRATIPKMIALRMSRILTAKDQRTLTAAAIELANLTVMEAGTLIVTAEAAVMLIAALAVAVIVAVTAATLPPAIAKITRAIIRRYLCREHLETAKDQDAACQSASPRKERGLVSEARSFGRSLRYWQNRDFQQLFYPPLILDGIF